MNTIEYEAKRVAMNDMSPGQFGRVVRGNFADRVVYRYTGSVILLDTGYVISRSYTEYNAEIVELLSEVKISASIT